MSGTDALARQVVDAFLRRGWMAATAESCTGGLIAAAITEIAGSSAVFDRGFVTYSNAAKMAMIGVAEETLKAHGAVSRETAIEMAKGALSASRADVAVSVTGIAGPGGGTPQKPVGLVHLAVASRSGRLDHEELRFGDIGRAAVRSETVEAALSALLRAVQAEDTSA
ncbi:MAG: CinA family protein [Pararhizobium sp.]